MTKDLRENKKKKHEEKTGKLFYNLGIGESFPTIKSFQNPQAIKKMNQLNSANK